MCGCGCVRDTEQGMPGGNSYRQWYAMRQRLQREGRWTHSVPRQEEGEPPAQRQRLEETAESPDTPESLPELEASPTAEGKMSAFGNGFSILAWVKDDSPLVEGHDGIARERIERDLLHDFCTLLSFRWTMDVNITCIEGTLYAFGTNPRITVSEATVRRAIGELSNHLDVLRGSVSTTADDLARYRACKRKWKVPDVTSDTGYGWERQEQAGTSTPTKRPRF